MLGNRERITTQFLCHAHDLPDLYTAFAGEFESCRLTRTGPGRPHALSTIPRRDWANAVFVDFYPPPPYSHPMTPPAELQRSPLTVVLAALSLIPPTTLGLYQVLFEPVSPDHNWHENIETLLDLEYRAKLLEGLTAAQRYPQQQPSGDLRQMAMDVETKSHKHKPIFAAALRVAIVGEEQVRDKLLRALAVVGAVIQHGGRPLCSLTHNEYRRRLSLEGIQSMFTDGATHRAGFLANSSELSTLVHIPPFSETEHFRDTLDTLEPLPAPEGLATGAPLGISMCSGERRPVCIPAELRLRHMHTIGATGHGKSTVLEHQVLYDIRMGHGVAVLDPHGRLVERLLRLIPHEFADRVAYFNPGDPTWVPLWNPLRPVSGQDIGATADNLVEAFKKVVSHWGDRLENLLRHAFFAALNMPGMTFLDISDLMRNRTQRAKAIRDQILAVTDNAVSQAFWLNDFELCSKDDLGPPKNKLSKLLLSGTTSLMLSQPDSRISFKTIMDEGGVLLVDLSSIGSQVRDILGCYMLELLRLTAATRDSTNTESLPPFHIYCDEAHRFMTDAMEDLLTESRKFGVSLTLAHQYMSQFSARKGDALAGVGSTVIFQVDDNDAKYLARHLLGEVKPKDLSRLEVGEAIARIGNHVVKLKTLDPLSIPEQHYRKEIIERSHARYYAPTDVVRDALLGRRERCSIGDGAAHDDRADAKPTQREQDVDKRIASNTPHDATLREQELPYDTL